MHLPVTSKILFCICENDRLKTIIEKGYYKINNFSIELKIICLRTYLLLLSFIVNIRINISITGFCLKEIYRCLPQVAPQCIMPEYNSVSRYLRPQSRPDSLAQRTKNLKSLYIEKKDHHHVILFEDFIF